MSIRFNIKGYVDRRGPVQLEAARAMAQEQADSALEEHWRRRVADNAKEIRRLTGMGQNVPMGGRGTGPTGKAWEPNDPSPNRCVQPTALQHGLTAPAALRRQAGLTRKY